MYFVQYSTKDNDGEKITHKEEGFKYLFDACDRADELIKEGFKEVGVFIEDKYK